MDDIERRLASYRPVDPPPDLRARIVDGEPLAGATAIREWLPTVAAVLLATIFYWLAADERARIASQVPAPADVTSAAPALESWP